MFCSTIAETDGRARIALQPRFAGQHGHVARVGARPCSLAVDADVRFGRGFFAASSRRTTVSVWREKSLVP